MRAAEGAAQAERPTVGAAFACVLTATPSRVRPPARRSLGTGIATGATGLAATSNANAGQTVGVASAGHLAPLRETAERACETARALVIGDAGVDSYPRLVERLEVGTEARERLIFGGARHALSEPSAVGRGRARREAHADLVGAAPDERQHAHDRSHRLTSWKAPIVAQARSRANEAA